MQTNTTILSLDEVRAGVQEAFRSAPGGIGNFTLRPSSLNADAIQNVERKLHVLLPSDFVRLLLTYEFSALDIGGVSFGDARAYDRYLIDVNSVVDVRWWIGNRRPEHRLLIAGTDGYQILLDVQSSRVLAFERTAAATNAEIIAKDFESFIRAAGTVALAQSISEEERFFECITVFAESSSPSHFWADRIRGYQ